MAREKVLILLLVVQLVFVFTGRYAWFPRANSISLRLSRCSHREGARLVQINGYCRSRCSVLYICSWSNQLQFVCCMLKVPHLRLIPVHFRDCKFIDIDIDSESWAGYCLSFSYGHPSKWLNFPVIAQVFNFIIFLASFAPLYLWTDSSGSFSLPPVTSRKPTAPGSAAMGTCTHHSVPCQRPARL